MNERCPTCQRRVADPGWQLKVGDRLPSDVDEAARVFEHLESRLGAAASSFGATLPSYVSPESIEVIFHTNWDNEEAKEAARELVDAALLYAVADMYVAALDEADLAQAIFIRTMLRGGDENGD